MQLPDCNDRDVCRALQSVRYDDKPLGSQEPLSNRRVAQFAEAFTSSFNRYSLTHSSRKSTTFRGGSWLEIDDLSMLPHRIKLHLENWDRCSSWRPGGGRNGSEGVGGHGQRWIILSYFILPRLALALQWVAPQRYPFPPHLCRPICTVFPVVLLRRSLWRQTSSIVKNTCPMPDCLLFSDPFLFSVEIILGGYGCTVGIKHGPASSLTLGADEMFCQYT